MKNRIVAIAIAGMLSLTVFAGCISLPWNSNGGNNGKMGDFSGDLGSFTSYEDIGAFLKKGAESTNSTYSRGGFYGPMLDGVSKGAAAPANAMEGASSDYSTTNIQVEGVDEADIVKTDGNYIYAVSNKWTESGSENKVVVIDAYSMQIVATVKAQNEISGIYINGDKLVVIENRYSYGPLYMVKSIWWGGYGESTTGMRVYDLSNMQKPLETYNYSISGNYFSSRMIGDWVYLVANEYVYVYDENYSNVTVPIICRNGQEEKMSPADIYYIDIPEQSYNYNNMLSLNVKDGRSSEKSFMIGSASEMYVSVENMYIINTNQWRFLWFGWGGYGYQNTTVNKFAISDGEITHVAKGEVPGYVHDQFSMDEYNGYFRIATTKGETWEGNSTSNVYVLDSGMKLAGKLPEDLAKGESIYSVRFIGSRCYIVTFKRVDPLFVIDLGDPRNPTLAGKLKIPGWSDYLHPYDENHIIGIGKDVNESIDADKVHSSDAVYYTAVLGIKMALFDVTDPNNLVEEAKTVIGDRGTYSEALDDHHAFLFSKEKNLLVIPATVYEASAMQNQPDYWYSNPSFEGAIAFRLTLEGGFEKIGSVTHQTTSPSGNPDWYPDYNLQVRRSLYIGNILYTVSNGMVKSSDLANGLAQIGSVKL
ncbi:MAG: beta-propeller domain-containing protein [Candidatus Thermoplasmatota archaeon]|nr:beta-propeller domain-containing protein [Candidatus Thermoplasmatota archaeon]